METETDFKIFLKVFLLKWVEFINKQKPDL